jgi:hypothetical protein
MPIKRNRKTPETRAERNIRWIEKYCLIPDGPTKATLCG